MLSGERSSGEMQDGLSGLFGLPLRWLGLYKPYPIRKFSIGTSIAYGCSSVTIDPQPWTCQINPLLNMHHAFSIYYHNQTLVIGLENYKVNQENMFHKTNAKPFKYIYRCISIYMYVYIYLLFTCMLYMY